MNANAPTQTTSQQPTHGQQPARESRDWLAIAERLAGERRLTVAQAAKLVASHGRRGHCSAAALVSWIVRGKRGVHLDAVRGAGKTWWTSAEAVSRFLAELSAQATHGRPPSPIATVGGLTPAQAERRAAAAVVKLKLLRVGVGNG